MPPQSTISYVPHALNADQFTSLNSYLPLLVLVIIAAAIAGIIVVLSWILGPKRFTIEKLSPYECGVNPIGSARERFPVKYYLIAMLFIVFDIETVFLYPWAVTFQHGLLSRQFLLLEMVVFMIILFVGYIYVWRKGALDWE